MAVWISQQVLLPLRLSQPSHYLLLPHLLLRRLPEHQLRLLIIITASFLSGRLLWLLLVAWCSSRRSLALRFSSLSWRLDRLRVDTSQSDKERRRRRMKGKYISLYNCLFSEGESKILWREDHHYHTSIKRKKTKKKNRAAILYFIWTE